MKKGLFYIVALICCIGFFSGCVKNGTERTITPSMNATIGTYAFTTIDVRPATIKPQLNDSATQLVIRGYEASSGDMITLTVAKYKNMQGTYSIVNGEASAILVNSTGTLFATGGVVAIKSVSNVINGYFSFTVPGGLSITDGTFVVGNPWTY